MTILVSLVKVHADAKGFGKLKPSQLYFGRYLTFFFTVTGTDFYHCAR